MDIMNQYQQQKQRERNMSEPATRKRKRASWILFATSFLCSTFVGFSQYFLQHFLLDLLFGIFSVAMMILCLVMFIRRHPEQPEHMGEATAQPKEAREDEAGPYQQQTTM
jgi:uncharacterized membrane protein YfcA